MRERRFLFSSLHFSIFVSPVIPSSRGDDLVHVSINKDHPRENAPSPTEVEGARPRDPAFNEGEACFLKHAFPFLGCQASIAVGYGMQVAVLIEGKPISEYEIYGTLDVAVFEVVPASVIV